MTKGLVSIITPCYNGEKYIDRCFASILSQTYKSIEVIAVDDGSTDNSLDILQSKVNLFTKEGMNLKIVSQSNRGLGGAIDTGLKHITGEFLLLLDVDDLLLPNAVESCINAFTEEIAIVRGDGFYVYDDSINVVNKRFTDTVNSEEHLSLFDALIYGKAYNWAGSYMVRTKELFEFYPDRCIYPSRYGQNLQMLLPLSYRYSDVFVNIPLMKYVQRKDSLSKSINTADNILGYMDIRLKLIDSIIKDEERKRMYEKAVRTIYNRDLLEKYCLNEDMKKAKECFKALKNDSAIDKKDRKLYYKYKLKSMF